MKQLNASKTVPPRVFVLTADKSKQAIILVRKTAKLTAVYAWDVNTNDIKLSQWLKGRIYEYFSDISTDGKHFLYSANKRGDGYTVISRTPWLKAIALWRNVGGYGGGVFYGAKSYALYDVSEAYCQRKNGDFKPVKNDELWQMGGVYPKRLQRLGWTVKSQSETEIVFCKPMCANIIQSREKFIGTRFIQHLNDKVAGRVGEDSIAIRRDDATLYQKFSHATVLEKVWSLNKGKTIGRGGFFEVHRVVSDFEIRELPTWEWCEIVGNRLVWAEKGCLFAAVLKTEMNLNAPTLIADFNHVQFEERVAPY